MLGNLGEQQLVRANGGEGLEQKARNAVGDEATARLHRRRHLLFSHIHGVNLNHLSITFVNGATTEVM